MAVTLATLCAPWSDLAIHGDGSVLVKAVVDDSRQAAAGTVFVAVRGRNRDGHDHVAAAVAAGVSAVVIDGSRSTELWAALPIQTPVAWVTASSTRGLPARLARECEGRPDQHLLLVGVTGTNGKTTTAFLLQSMLSRLQGSCGLLGTIHYDDGKARAPARLTTPNGPVLYHWLSRMVRSGCAAGALEISSHALDQDRTGDLALDAAVLTNLGRDHLDYHLDRCAYLAAKARILDLLTPGPRRGKEHGVAVINVRDPAFAPLADKSARAVLYAVDDPDLGSADPGKKCDLSARIVELSRQAIRLELDWRGQRLEVTSPLVGRFNAENLTAALATGLALGHDPASCCEAISEVRQVPGRVERFALPAGGMAVVDYAHTHDALAAVLRACKELGRGRLSVVFGCGGDRDRGKRPLMGRVAAELADMTWITSDNPRREDPRAICDEIHAGYTAVRSPQAGRCEIILDRRDAIETALGGAAEGDVVVVAGKGHEEYQQVGDEILPFDDRRIIRDWIAREEGHA